MNFIDFSCLVVEGILEYCNFIAFFFCFFEAEKGNWYWFFSCWVNCFKWTGFLIFFYYKKWFDTYYYFLCCWDFGCCRFLCVGEWYLYLMIVIILWFFILGLFWWVFDLKQNYLSFLGVFYQNCGRYFLGLGWNFWVGLAFLLFTIWIVWVHFC